MAATMSKSVCEANAVTCFCDALFVLVKGVPCPKCKRLARNLAMQTCVCLWRLSAEGAAGGSRKAKVKKLPSLSKTSDTLSYAKALQQAVDKLKEQLPDNAMASRLEAELQGCLKPIGGSLANIIR